MAARLKIDENLPDEIAALFVRHGCDAVTVADQGWCGIADRELWRRIQDEGRWLVTADKELADRRRRPPGAHAGTILFVPAKKGWMRICCLRKASSMTSIWRMLPGR